MANAIVGQSGGPTSVINASLAGVFQACQMRGAMHVYGMLHGIQGLLEEKVCDLTEHMKSFIDLELLKRTPSSFLGSCRYKLPAPEDDEAVYEKLFAILKKLDIATEWYTDRWGLHLFELRKEVKLRQQNINNYLHSDKVVIYDVK